MLLAKENGKQTRYYAKEKAKDVKGMKGQTRKVGVKT